MFSLKNVEQRILQRSLKSVEQRTLQRLRAARSDNLPTRIDEYTHERYVLWSDVQVAFVGAHHVLFDLANFSRAFFMVDKTYQVYDFISGIMRPRPSAHSCKPTHRSMPLTIDASLSDWSTFLTDI